MTNEKNRALPDLSGREWAMMVPTIAICIFMGVFPNVFLRPMEPSVRKVIDQVNGTTTVARAPDHGPGITDHRPRTTDHGPRTTDPGPRTTNHGAGQ